MSSKWTHYLLLLFHGCSQMMVCTRTLEGILQGFQQLAKLLNTLTIWQFASTAINLFIMALFLLQVVQENAFSYLSEDGEPVYRLSRFAGYLHLARCIFVECRHLCTSLQVRSQWCGVLSKTLSSLTWSQCVHVEYIICVFSDSTQFFKFYFQVKLL